MTATASPSKSGKSDAKVSDVVAAARVSQALVYSFLSGKYYGAVEGAGIGISAETQSRIIAACRQVGYVPNNPELRNRVYPELGEFAFLLSSQVAEGISNVYFAPMMEGAATVTKDRQMAYSAFSDTADFLVSPELLPPPVKAGRANKFLIAGAINYSLLHAILPRRGRIVYLSRFVKIPGIVSVVPDYARGVELAIAHLVKLGHRHIAAVAEHYFQPDAYNTRQLLEGLRSAMAAHRLPFAESEVLYKTVSGPEKVSSVMPRLLARKPRPTAVFCFDDWTAKCMYQAAAEAGLRVPADLSIVGFNDDRTAAYMVPPLTTVHLPTHEMGRRGAEELERLSQSEEPPEPRCIMLPVELAVRSSSAPPTR